MVWVVIMMGYVENINDDGMALSGYVADKPLKIGQTSVKKAQDSYTMAHLVQTESEPVTYSRAKVMAQYQAHQTVHVQQTVDEKLEEQELMALQKRDREVRMHEQTHAAVLGPYAGAIRYKYKVGSDGKMYADGGSIVVRTQFGGDSPAAMYHRASRMRRSAMANASPSPADMATAVRATRMQQRAMAAKLREE